MFSFHSKYFVYRELKRALQKLSFCFKCPDTGTFRILGNILWQAEITKQKNVDSCNVQSRDGTQELNLNSLNLKKKIDCSQSRILSMFCIQNMQKVLKVKTSSVNVKSSFFFCPSVILSAAFVYKASIAEDF